MKEITLSNGEIALVDDEDYPALSKYRWFSSRGHAVALIDGKLNSMHRFLLNPPSDMQVDHINGERADNRRANLRIVEPRHNSWNSARHKNADSSLKGLTRIGVDKWRARIRANGKILSLGVYATEEEAARAYDDAARRFFGEYARTNF